MGCKYLQSKRHLVPRGIGIFLVLYGSFNYNDAVLCAGLGIIAVMVILSIIVPKLNPGKYQKQI